MNTYFKFKLATEYIIPLSIFTLIVMVVLVRGIKESIREYRIKKFFESNGYERTLLGMAGFGGDTYYGWIRQPDESKQIAGQYVDDRDLRGLPIKVIKKKYK
jgi:hypothetical protein